MDVGQLNKDEDRRALLRMDNNVIEGDLVCLVWHILHKHQRQANEFMIHLKCSFEEIISFYLHRNQSGVFAQEKSSS
jgi:hypothetical protein